jgi:hypothetical protein
MDSTTTMSVYEWIALIFAGAVPLSAVIASWVSLSNNLARLQIELRSLEKQVNRQERDQEKRDAHDESFREFVRSKLEVISADLIKLQK